MTPTELVALRAAYERERDEFGVTVAEFEEANNLPRYTLFPWAARAKLRTSAGFYMYETAQQMREREALEGAVRLFNDPSSWKEYRA